MTKGMVLKTTSAGFVTMLALLPWPITVEKTRNETAVGRDFRQKMMAASHSWCIRSFESSKARFASFMYLVRSSRV